MSAWKINGSTAEALGAENLRCRQRSLADGAFTFTAAGRDVDDSPLFGYREVVTLTKDRTTWWTGPCIRRPVSGAGGAESHEYEIASPWWYLENIPYLQQWSILAGTSAAWLSRCILGVNNLVTTRVTIGEAVALVVAYARDCGAPIRAGTIAVDGWFPIEEVKGLMCAEVIRRILRWAPDAVGWWEFGTTSSLHIQRRADLPAVAFGFSPELHAVSMTPRDEMAPSAVVLQYERVDTVDDVAVTTITSDAAPPGATGRGIGALVYTIPLQGGETTYLKQDVKTRPIGDGNTTTQYARRWWGKVVPALQHADRVADDEITPQLTFHLLDGTNYFLRTLGNPSGTDTGGDYELADPDDSSSEKTYLLDLTRELIEGTVLPWMSGVQAQRQVIRAKISWTESGAAKGPQEFSVPFTATDATTRTYVQVESVVDGEEPTSGLAAALLAAFSTPHYQGSVTIEDAECSRPAAIGNVINFTGGQSEWRTMDALVQQLDEDIDAGRTVITCGPPEHLGPQDLIELQRSDRRTEGNTRQRYDNIERRNSGTL